MAGRVNMCIRRKERVNLYSRQLMKVNQRFFREELCPRCKSFARWWTNKNIVAFESSKVSLVLFVTNAILQISLISLICCACFILFFNFLLNTCFLREQIKKMLFLLKTPLKQALYGNF